MATRFYFPSSGSAPHTPSFGVTGAAWTDVTNAERFKLVTTKISSSNVAKQRAKTGGSGTTKCLVQYVSDPLSAQTISGTVKGQIRCAESNGNFSAVLTVTARIVQADGSDYATPRILFSLTNSDLYTTVPPEFATTTTLASFANRGIQNTSESFSITLTSRDASAGDHLVIEIGYYSNSASTTYTAGVAVGDNSATDLSEQTAITTANNPWIEFSGTILVPQTFTQTMSVQVGQSNVNEQLTQNQKDVETDLTGITGANGDVTRDTNIKHSGNASAKMVVYGGGNSEIFIGEMPVTQGMSVHGRCWGRADVGTLGSQTLTLAFGWFNGDTNTGYSFEETDVSAIGENTWYEFSYDYPAPAGCNKVVIGLGMVNGVSGDMMWYDDATLYDNAGGSFSTVVSMVAEKLAGNQTPQSLVATSGSTLTLSTLRTLRQTLTGVAGSTALFKRDISFKLIATMGSTALIGIKRTLLQNLVGTLSGVLNLKKDIGFKLTASSGSTLTLSSSKTFPQTLTGTLTSVNKIILQSRLKLNATMGSTVVLIKNIGLKLNVTEVSVLDLKRTTGLKLNVVSTNTVILIKRIGLNLNVTEVSVLDLKKSIGLNLSVIENSIINLRKAIGLKLNTTEISVIGFKRTIGLNLNIIESLTTTLKKDISLKFGVTIPTNSILSPIKVKLQALNSTTTPISILKNRPNLILGVVLSTQNYLKRDIRLKLGVVLNSVNILSTNNNRVLSQNLDIVSTSILNLKRDIGKKLDVISSTTPNLIKSIAKKLEVTTSISNILNTFKIGGVQTYNQNLTGSISTISSLRNLIGKKIDAVSQPVTNLSEEKTVKKSLSIQTNVNSNLQTIKQFRIELTTYILSSTILLKLLSAYRNLNVEVHTINELNSIKEFKQLLTISTNIRLHLSADIPHLLLKIISTLKFGLINIIMNNNADVEINLTEQISSKFKYGDIELQEVKTPKILMWLREE